MGYDAEKDIIKAMVRINLSEKFKSARTERDLEYNEIPKMLSMKITKKLLLAVVHSCYDPIGLIVPITVQMKIGLRKLYTHVKKFDWDDELPEDIKKEWVRTFQRVKEAEKVEFKRCIKPPNSQGNPDLIICNDGSDLAMCATAHIRWECDDGNATVQLWSAKSRVTPLRRQTTPRTEMQSAVMGARLATTIKQNSLWDFDNVYHIVDSECTIATLRKETTALKTYMGNRASEILETTTVDQFLHVDTKDNIADLGTRNDGTVDRISGGSPWQIGEWWMPLPKRDWPVNQKEIGEHHIPEEELIKNQICANVNAEEPAFSFQKYEGRSYQFVMNMMARLKRIAKNKSFRGGAHYTVQNLKDAEKFVLMISMQRTKKLLDQGKLTPLRAEEGTDGIIRLGSRALEGLQTCYESKDFPILAYDDPIAHLWIKSVHNEDHSGVTRTVAKSRRKFGSSKQEKLPKQ